MQNGIIIRWNFDLTKTRNSFLKSFCHFGLNCCFADVCGVKKKVFDSEVRVTVVNKACEHGPNGACLLGVPGL